MNEKTTRTKFAQEFLIVNIVASIILLIAAATQLPEEAHSIYDRQAVEIVMVLTAAFGAGACFAYRQLNNLRRECAALKKMIEVSKLEIL